MLVKKLRREPARIPLSIHDADKAPPYPVRPSPSERGRAARVMPPKRPVVATSFDHVHEGKDSVSGDLATFTSRKLDLINAMLIDPRLKASGFRVAVVVLQFLNSETGQCNPALGTIAELVNLSVRTVENGLVSLRETGWIRWTRGNRQKSNHYQFDMTNVGAMLDRRTSIDDARRERQRRRSDTNQISPQDFSTGKRVPASTRNLLQVSTRSGFPSNTSMEHRKGTPESGLGIEQDDAVLSTGTRVSK